MLRGRVKGGTHQVRGDLDTTTHATPELEGEKALRELGAHGAHLEPSDKAAEGRATHDGSDLVAAIGRLLALQKGNQAAAGQSITGLGGKEAVATTRHVDKEGGGDQRPDLPEEIEAVARRAGSRTSGDARKEPSEATEVVTGRDGRDERGGVRQRRIEGALEAHVLLPLGVEGVRLHGVE